MTNLESCNKHNIVNWEYILLGMTEAKDSEVCKITRADGTSSFHGDFQALLRRLDRQDLFQLYSLVQERYKHRSIEGHDLDLWGDLKMMFDPNEEDDIWLNQHYWELLRWKLHEYSGVHSLFLDGTSIQINMLVDKKYPLKKEILKKMINLKIEAEEESDMASELIKFIKSHIVEQKQKIHSIRTIKDSKTSKIKKEKYTYLALKARKVSSDQEESCSGSDEEYAMVSESGEEDESKRDEFCLVALDNNEGIASTSKPKTEKLGQVGDKMSIVEPAELVPSAREPTSSMLGNRPSVE
ncbi:hypothetical protein Tco_1225672, partial [Tanacetum coccineum]